MGKCAQCGNDYEKSFEVTMGGRTLVFDSFECAIQALAPVCPITRGPKRRQQKIGKGLRRHVIHHLRWGPTPSACQRSLVRSRR